MAKITVIEEIASGNIQAIKDNNDAAVENTNILTVRDVAAPTDISEIFLDKETAQRYAQGENVSSIQLGVNSYVGQHLKVIDKDNNTADTYQIQNVAGDLRKFLAEPLKGHEFDFDNCTLKDVLLQVIEALGGTIKEEQS